MAALVLREYLGASWSLGDLSNSYTTDVISHPTGWRRPLAFVDREKAEGKSQDEVNESMETFNFPARACSSSRVTQIVSWKGDLIRVKGPAGTTSS